MTAEYLRPADAAARFGVCERTLARWANAGLIGRSHRGRMVFYVVSDIVDAIQHGLQPRTVVPLSADPSLARPESNWRDDPLWTPVAPSAAAPRAAGRR